ncbi:MAG: hypothetical protein OEN56_15005 [Gemmatimonadota bacterium]|nr:hypothetical protein [Gemmatimonadota bacterium]
MASEKSIWFHIGHAFERARAIGPAPAKSVPRSGGREGSDDPPALRPSIPSSDELLSAGIALVVDKALDGWGKRSEPGITRLLRAAAAGAVAALLVDLVRPLLRDNVGLPSLDRETVEHILAGIGQGLVYGSIVEPRLPGPALMKGAMYGSVEYMVDPIGGLSGIFGSRTPQRKLPFVGDLFDGLDEGERAYLEHLVFGIALAVVYESSLSSNGMRAEEEPDGE